MAATEQEINKRLRSLHQDFDFLLDNNVISSDLYDQLVEKIPRRYNAAGKSTTVPTASSPAPVSPAPDSVSTLATRLESSSISSQGGVKSPPPAPPAHTASPPPAYGLAQAEALYNYSSPDEGDLPLIAGQKITILEYDWWRGEGPNGQQGIFPSNYVRKIEGTNEKGAPQYGAPVPYQQYGGGYPGQQYQQPVYQQPQYVAPQPQPAPAQQEEQKHQGGGKLAQFGKNYGKTFVNATAWGGGMTLGADVINKIF